MDINIADILLQYLVLLFSLCFHEAAHAWMSNRCGDPSARLLGRMTLDPRKHIDPLGTVVLPLIMMTTGVSHIFGWAKPVPFNPRNLNNMRRDPVLIALAGPASNLLIAVVCTFLLRIICILSFDGEEFVFTGGMAIAFQITEAMIMINLLLMLFNVIPLPPLDGHYVLKYFLPPNAEQFLERIGPMGIIITILFIVGPWLRFALPKLMNVVYVVATYGL